MTQQKIGRHISQAHKFHSQGKLPEAQHLCIRVLKKSPDHAAANYLLGLIAGETGDLQQAAILISKAIEKTPGNAIYYHALGKVFFALGNCEQASIFYLKAIELEQNNAEFFYDLGNTLLLTGSFDEAREVLLRAVEIRPDYAEAYNSLGVSLEKINQHEKALEAFTIASHFKPQYWDPLYNQGKLLYSCNRFDEAVLRLRDALAINPGHIDTLNTLGNICRELMDLDVADECYSQALQLEPGNKTALIGRGNLALFNGKKEQAAQYYRKSLATGGEGAVAYLNLANAGEMTDDDIRNMEEVLASEANTEEKIYLNFALGKACESKKEYARAFSYFERGNDLKHSTTQYSRADAKKHFSDIKEIFNEKFLNKNDTAGNCDDSIIFIIGMPRSGTSLVEQILASHPEVFGAGELPYMGNIAWSTGSDDCLPFPKNMTELGHEDFYSMGCDYLQYVRSRAGAAQRIVDKLPHNFLYAGLIQLILPNARIIHCVREAKSNCTSIYTNYFFKHHPYAYDMEDIGDYYNLYQSLIEHWHEVLPGVIHNIHYEELINNRDECIRELLEFCGLEWTDACTDFHKTSRPVTTLSANQVRKPVYRHALESWKRYEKELAPLFQHLR